MGIFGFLRTMFAPLINKKCREFYEDSSTAFKIIVQIIALVVIAVLVLMVVYSK
ncbi:MAG TPA: hypothetical protein GXZ61_01355 [Clostridiales bacterium]|nr:hypothetical protein [Clostridiales bacterium]